MMLVAAHEIDVDSRSEQIYNRHGNKLRQFIKIDAEIAHIPLTRGYFAIVDLEDAPALCQYLWSANVRANNYVRAVRWVGRTCIYMHHDLLPLVAGYETDHDDGNPLNNRRDNLISVTHKVNLRKKIQRNGRKGICFNRRANLWMVYIDEFDKKRVHLGYTKTREDAMELLEATKC